MLRRSITAYEARMPQYNIKDWSKITKRLEDTSIGHQFDKGVLDPSVIPTRHLQRGLFRLPIPKLEDTVRRYTACLQPLLPPAQFEKSKKLLEEFQSGEGRSLHASLVATDKVNSHTSFISDDWFDLYLRDRSPLPIHYNPSLVTRFDPDKRDGVLRAAYWIASSVRWYKRYLENTLKPEVFFFGSPKHYCRSEWFARTVAMSPEFIAAKVMAIGSKFHAFPLDMSQYDNLFNSTRLPGTIVDQIQTSSFVPHIIVNHRGHQFSVTVADNDCNPLPEEQIYARLKAIVDLDIKPPQVDVGIYTSMNRTDWHGVRTSLARNPTNLKSLEKIDSALFVVNLDTDDTVDFTTQESNTKSNKYFIATPQNRWWDKSLSVIFTKNGAAGVNFEHSWGDGVAVLRYTVDCFNDSIGRKSGGHIANPPAPTEPVQQLQWELDDALKATAETAKKRFTDEINRMDYSIAVVDSFGKADKVFKGAVKPDPFLQMAMQLAWWRLNQSTVSTYESASTAAFFKGRTECIRSASVPSQAFTLAFDNPKVDDQTKAKLLADAAKHHANISKEAKMGNGVDRHLFALRKLAERKGKEVAIFKDPSYATFGSNIISTSSLFSEALLGGGFGPVSPGYGIGYCPLTDCLQYNVSCWKTNGPNHSADDFAAALCEASIDMHALLSKHTPQ